MLKTIESKGDTIDAAIEKALLILGLERDSVSVEVLQNPKAGFLGIGKEPAVVKVSYETSPMSKAKDFVDGLLYRFGTPASIEASEDAAQRTITLELSGDNMGAIIGRRGDTLDAIQYLASIVANRDEDERWRVTVDTEDYRAKRETTLYALAEKTAQKALKYKKAVALEPMNPHERRMIHTALQEVEGVTTYSTGSEPNRKVIVAPGDGSQKLPRESKPSGGSGSGSSQRRRRRRRPSGPRESKAE